MISFMLIAALSGTVQYCVLVWRHLCAIAPTGECPIAKPIVIVSVRRVVRT